MYHLQLLWIAITAIAYVVGRAHGAARLQRQLRGGRP
jgi:hypothetical protein